MIDRAINLEIFEICHAVQGLVKNGWVFGEIDYGDERFDIGPSIILTKGDVTKHITNYQKIWKIENI